MMLHTTATENATIQCADGGDAQAPRLDAVSYTGALMRRVKAYDAPVVVDLDGLTGLGETHPVYRNHDDSRILGVGVTTRNGNSLVTAGELTNENDDVTEITRLGKKSFPFQASVGVDPTKVEKLPAKQTATVNGNLISGPAYIVRAGKLYEVSVVSRGADDQTSTRIAAAMNKENGEMEFATFVSDNGFDIETLSDKQTAVLRAAYDKQHGDSGKTVESVIEAAKQRDARSKNYARVIEAAIANGMDTSTAEKLIEAASRDQLSETEFELQVLRLQRAPSFNTQRHSGGDISAEVVEAAVARSIGGDVEKMYKPEVLEASERRFKHGMSLVELLQLSARRNGHRDISHRDVNALLRASFAPIEAAGASTYSLSGVLSNITNRSIRSGFDAVESVWREISAITPMSDLKPLTSYSIAGDFSFEDVGKGSELKHATMSEESYVSNPKTTGRMFAIDRASILNDDLGVFNRVRLMLGRGAAQKLNMDLWKEWLSDASTYWTTARKNKIASSATTVLGLDSLGEAWNTFMDKVDPQGAPLGISPAILLVPSRLHIIGEQLTKDPEIRYPAASARTAAYSVSNPHAGKMKSVSSAYLSNSSIPNSSAKNWFLLADPMDMPCMEVSFLFNRQQPWVESADADFNTLGIQLRGFFDYSLKKTEFRANLLVEDTN